MVRCGSFNRYSEVDLSRGRLTDYEIPEKWSKKYLGGRGLEHVFYSRSEKKRKEFVDFWAQAEIHDAQNLWGFRYSPN